MGKPIHILIIEDSEDDTQLLLRELRRGGYDPIAERVDTAEAMKSALGQTHWDLIVSDYIMPRFSGLAALNILMEKEFDVPFIIVSGNIGEDIAVNAMRAGVHDYIIKGNLTRLVPAVERELRDAETRRERRRTEEQLKESRQKLFETLETINEGFFTLDGEWRFSYINAEAARLWKKPREELLGRSLWDIAPMAADSVFDEQYHRAIREQMPVMFEALSPLLGIWVEVRAYPNKDGLAVYFHDISDRKETESRINITNNLLALYASKQERREYLDAAVELILAWSGCRHVGIRISDKFGRLPFESCRGYTETFLETEGSLSLSTDNCVCIRVFFGTVDYQDIRAMTPHGSFYSNNTMKFMAGLTAEERAKYRGHCMLGGYTSLAVIPIQHRSRVVGAIHLADSRPDMIPLAKVEFLEYLAHIIGEAILRFDIEEELRANYATLQKTTELLERIFSTTHMLVAYMDKNFNFIRVNRAYADSENRDPEYFVGRNFFSLHPDNKLEEIFWKTSTSAEPYHAYESVFGSKKQTSEETKYWDWSLMPVTEADKKFSGLLLTLVDVTIRKKAEDNLRKASAYNRSLIEASLDPLITINPDGIISDLNAATEAATGVTREKLIGTDFSIYFSEPDKARSGFLQAFRKGSVRDYALEIRNQNGRLTPVLYNVSLYRDETGKIGGLFAAARDITDHRENERRIMVINKLLKLFTQTSSRKEYLNQALDIIRLWCGCFYAGIREVSRERNIPYTAHSGFDDRFIEIENMISLNRDHCACTRAMNSLRDQIDSTTMTENGSIYYNNSVKYLNSLSPEQQKRYQCTCHKRGFMSIAVVPIRYRDTILGALHIADEREGMFPPQSIDFLEHIALIMGEALYRFSIEEEQVRLASALQSSADAVVITDPQSGVIQYVNEAFEVITGYTKNEALGRTLHILESRGDSEQHYRELRESLRRDGVWRGQFVSQRKDGSLYFEDCTFSTVRDASGQIINFVSVRRDVTEKMRLESIAEAVNTMDNIGYVFSGVRHEIGNPINSAKMSLNVLQRKLDTASKDFVRDYVERTLGEIGRVEQLLKNLRNYTLYETLELQDTNLKVFMQKFFHLVTDDFARNGIVLRHEIHKDAEWAVADSRALQQVLLNLFTNSADALVNRPSPEIVVAIMRKFGQVLLQIIDNGCGMTETQQKNLFKPFYTSKPHGTGLGLVIVKKMVARMSGKIEILSTPGRGTIVSISLPEGQHNAA
jgi:PAS domain S-box-containing protein